MTDANTGLNMICEPSHKCQPRSTPQFSNSWIRYHTTKELVARTLQLVSRSDKRKPTGATSVTYCPLRSSITASGRMHYPSPRSRRHSRAATWRHPRAVQVGSLLQMYGHPKISWERLDPIKSLNLIPKELISFSERSCVNGMKFNNRSNFWSRLVSLVTLNSCLGVILSQNYQLLKSIHGH